MALLFETGTFVQQVGTGNQPVTGIGFQGKALFLFGSQPAEGFTGVMQDAMGFAVSSSSRCSISAVDRNGQATIDANRAHSNVHCYSVLANSAGGGSNVDEADFVSFDSDGFTINWTTNAGNQRLINYVVIGGTDLTDVFIKEIQSPTSPGSQGSTGVGFQPDCALFLTGGGAATPSPGFASLYLQGLGWATSSSARGATGIGGTDNVADSVTNRSQVSDKVISVGNNDSFNLEADLTSFDSDGFTLNWSTVQGTPRYCWVLCLKGGSYKVGADTQKTSPGTKATTGVGFTPAGLLLQSVGATSSSSLQATVSRSVGAASSASSRCSNWQGAADAAATSDTNRYQDDASCISIGNAADTIIAQADLSSLDSDGFTLNWGTADATAREFLYLAFGSNSSGTELSGAGASAGVASAAAVGASEHRAVGSTAGVASAAATGASQHSASGSAAGVASAAAVGASEHRAAGSAGGVAVVNGVSDGEVSLEGAGSSAGVASAAAVGASEHRAVGSTAGVASAAATGASQHSASGSAAGVATSAAVGTSEHRAAGSASGAANVIGISPSAEGLEPLFILLNASNTNPVYLLASDDAAIALSASTAR